MRCERRDSGREQKARGTKVLCFVSSGCRPPPPPPPAALRSQTHSTGCSGDLRVMPERKPIKAFRPNAPAVSYIEEDEEDAPNKKQFFARALLLICLMLVAIGAAYDIGTKLVASPKVRASYLPCRCRGLCFPLRVSVGASLTRLT